MEFKVGREVTLTNYTDFGTPPLLNCNYKGIFKIVRVYEDDGEPRFSLTDIHGNLVTFNVDTVYSFIEEELELYYPKVNVGDKVIFTSNKNLPFVTKGKSYTISRIDSNHYYVENSYGFLYRHQFRLKRSLNIKRIYDESL